MLVQIHDNGGKCSSGPRQWWKLFFRSMTLVEKVVQVHDNGGNGSSGP